MKKYCRMLYVLINLFIYYYLFIFVINILFINNINKTLLVILMVAKLSQI